MNSFFQNKLDTMDERMRELVVQTAETMLLDDALFRVLAQYKSEDYAREAATQLAIIKCTKQTIEQ